MRKHGVVCVALLIVILAVGGAFAHKGEMKYMFQFPAGLEPELDGDLSDWDIVGEFYRSRAENMFNQFGAPSPHGKVLFNTISVGHHHGTGYTVVLRSKGNALTMIATRRGNHPAQSRLGSDELL